MHLTDYITTDSRLSVMMFNKVLTYVYNCTYGIRCHKREDIEQINHDNNSWEIGEYVNRNLINSCEGNYYDSDTPKPENKLYNFIYEYWTWPFVNPGCECCSAVRG